MTGSTGPWWRPVLGEALSRRSCRRLRAHPGEVRAAVLIPLLAGEDRLDLLLVRRAAGLASHAGQVAFPGGALEPDDADAEQAALREAWEEVALPAEAVEVVGTLQDFRTPTGFVISPVVGVVGADVTLQASPGEVEAMFRVPVAHLLDPAALQVVTVERRGLFYRGEALVLAGHVVWGATARMLVALRRALLSVDGPWHATRSRRPDLVERCRSDDCSLRWGLVIRV